MNGDDHPLLRTTIPGPGSRVWVDRLAMRECPGITARRSRRALAMGVADTDPIVWDKALGANVLDVDGNRYVDLTAGFGVASVGHANHQVVSAGQDRMEDLPHAMGDAFPDPGRIRLLERLAALTGLDRGILGSSGSDSVEAALKTARMATGRDRIISFEGGYHGLTYGALAVCGYKRGDFAAPFSGQLPNHTQRLPWAVLPESLEEVAAVIVEPIQGRGGIREVPKGFLRQLRQICDRDGALLILDEYYTGFGRCGEWFAFQQENVSPDLLVLGKALGGGFPISACLGTRTVMDSWGASSGEAIHTQTFLGNPVGCAMAMAVLDEVERLELAEQAQSMGEWFKEELSHFGPVRGRGLLLGVEIPDAYRVCRGLLSYGYIALPAGERSEVIALTPPLTITQPQLEGFLEALEDILDPAEGEE